MGGRARPESENGDSVNSHDPTNASYRPGSPSRRRCGQPRPLGYQGDPEADVSLHEIRGCKCLQTQDFTFESVQDRLDTIHGNCHAPTERQFAERPGGGTELCRIAGGYALGGETRIALSLGTPLGK